MNKVSNTCCKRAGEGVQGRWDSENIHVKIFVPETFVKITHKVIILETISSGHPALIHVTQ